MTPMMVRGIRSTRPVWANSISCLETEMRRHKSQVDINTFELQKSCINAVRENRNYIESWIDHLFQWGFPLNLYSFLRLSSNSWTRRARTPWPACWCDIAPCPAAQAKMRNYICREEFFTSWLWDLKTKRRGESDGGDVGLGLDSVPNPLARHRWLGPDTTDRNRKESQFQICDAAGKCHDT